MKRKDKKGFASLADNIEAAKVGARVNTPHGIGTVEEVGEFYAWVKIDGFEVVKILHKEISKVS